LNVWIVVGLKVSDNASTAAYSFEGGVLNVNVASEAVGLDYGVELLEEVHEATVSDPQSGRHSRVCENCDLCHIEYNETLSVGDLALFCPKINKDKNCTGIFEELYSWYVKLLCLLLL